MLKTELDPLRDTNQPDMHRTDYEYDSRHLLINKTEGADAAGGARAVTLFAYDAAARLVSSTDPLGRATLYEYDSRDRLDENLSYADGSTERMSSGSGTGSDANLLVKQKDRNGNVTQYEYDSADRLIKTITAFSTDGFQWQ